MAKLKNTGWQHGLRSFVATTLEHIIWVQKSPDGWFSKLENEDHKLMVLTGPWGSQEEAEQALVKALVHVCELD